VSKVPCRSTRHCADWGFCHRCAPNLADLQDSLGTVLGEDPSRDTTVVMSDYKRVTQALSLIIALTKKDIPPLKNKE